MKRNHGNGHYGNVCGVFEVAYSICCQEGGTIVNFIERLFGLSPDTGGGSFETMLLVLPLLCLAVTMLVRQRHLFRRKCD
jgi:hypothetical protein